jgi:hypothetical protein
MRKTGDDYDISIEDRERRFWYIRPAILDLAVRAAKRFKEDSEGASTKKSAAFSKDSKATSRHPEA